jgi:hypothetical protein
MVCFKEMSQYLPGETEYNQKSFENDQPLHETLSQRQWR